MSKLRLKKAIAILAILLQSIGTQAQSFLWDVDFLGFFDNREYNTALTPSQTFFGVRLSPEVGIGFLDNKHRLMAGASWRPSGICRGWLAFRGCFCAPRGCMALASATTS